MRLLELHASDDSPRLEFHRRVTVVRGLEAGTVDRLKSLLRDLTAGRPPAWDGTVEVHGVLIGLEGMARLVGPAIGEPVIARIEEVLPPVPGPPRGGPDDPQARRHDTAVAARGAIETKVSDLAGQLATIGGARAGLNERLEAARTRIDRQAATALDVADSELRAAARAARIGPYETLTDPAARRAYLNEIIEECDKTLPGLPAGDRANLAAANATLRAALSNGEVVSPEAAALADAWSSLHRRLDWIESRLQAASGNTEAIAARLEAARGAAAKAQAAGTPREVTPEEEERLEELHSEVGRLQIRATTGIRRGTAKKHLNEVHARLQAELEGLGYPTFMAFRLGNGLSTVDASREQELDAAIAALVEAERDWDELMNRLERDEELNDVLVAIEHVSERAAELLGVDLARIEDEAPEDLAQRLREVRVDADSLDVELDEAVEHLKSVLDGAGSVGHRGVFAPEAVVALGESWLEVLRAADDAAVRVLRDRERVDAELSSLQDTVEGAEVDVLTEPRTRLAQAEIEVSELRRGLSSLALVRRELHELAVAELTIAENHDAKLELLEAARAMEERAATQLPANIRIETTRRGITALVPRGLGGPVPMIVDLGDIDDESLDHLVAIPDDVQVIAIGGGAGVVDWVARIGSDRAGLVDIGAHV